MIIYLAGAETHWKMMLECGVRNQLYSFFHMRTMRGKAFSEMIKALQEEQERRLETDEPPLRLFLDSGTAKYVNHKGKKPDPHMYFREYKECLASTRDLWNYATEMNLDSVGQAQVSEWRDELLTVQTDCIVPVWQELRGQSRWDYYCQDPRYPYLAFGPGLDAGAKSVLCHKAHLAGKQVHAMAETKLQTDIKYLNADSFSSALWLNAQKYGSLYVFHGNQLRLIEKKNKQDRKLFKLYFEASGIDFAQLMADDPYTVNKCSLIAWRNMATRLEQQGDRQNGRRNEADNNATDSRRNRLTRENGQRNGAANVAGKSNVDQSTGEFQGMPVRGSGTVQGGSVTGAKRSFGLRRVYGDTANAQGVNHVQETDSVRQGRAETVGGGDQRVHIQNSAISGTIRSTNDGPFVTSGTKIIWEDSGHSRNSGQILDASPMKTRWILDRKLGRLVPSLVPAAVDLCGVQCPNNDLFCDLYYKHTGDHEGDIGGQRQGFGTGVVQAGVDRGTGDRTVFSCQCGYSTEIESEAKKHVNTHAEEAFKQGRRLGETEATFAVHKPDEATAITLHDDQDIVSYPKEIEDDVNTLSANMPKTVCDNCAISGECKEYSPGAVCFFDDDFGKLPIRNLDTNLAEREVLLKFDRTRLMRAIMAERVSGGGALDSRVSQAMDDYIRRKNDFVTMAKKRNTTAVTASVTARGKPGIFSQMFGAGMPTGKREEGDTEIPLNDPMLDTRQSDGDVEITMTVTKDVPSKK